MFNPHVLPVQVGTAVDFPNSDPIFHNAFSNYEGQVFDLQLYAPKTTRRVVFRRPGIVHVFCNVHEGMSAVIAVLPTPYFALTGADGRFQIQVPPGAYKLQVWNEHGQPESLSRLEQRITVGSDDVTYTTRDAVDRGAAVTSSVVSGSSRPACATWRNDAFPPGGCLRIVSR